MRKLIALITLFSCGLTASDAVAPLTIDLPESGARITIPGMPPIEMAVHPMNELKPYFRLRGDRDRISVSVLTPTIDGEITPFGCATAIANAILSQGQVSREQVFLGRADERTFLIIYGLPLPHAVLLNTHIVSASNAAHCLEAHVSKISTSDDDIEPWYNGFGESSIDDL